MAEEKKNVSGKVEKATTDAKKSDAAKKVAKAAKGNKSAKEKKPNIFVRAGRAIKKFFKDFRGESKKIVWPDGKTVLKSSLIVIVVVAIVSVIVFGIDMGLAKIIEGLQTLATGSAEATTEAVTEATTEATTAATTAAAGLINFVGSLLG
ncbi:MAG: preprotein translocase subunit SecE [Oscillospiraceae bacterium]